MGPAHVLVLSSYIRELLMALHGLLACMKIVTTIQLLAYCM